MENLILLESIFDEKKALEIKIILERNNIFHKYFRSRNNIEKAYGMSNSTPTEIWVYEKDFETSFQLINELNVEKEQIITEDLDNFSNEELIDIIKNKDEWHESFVNKAYSNCTKKGINLNEIDINKYQTEKLQKIKTGKAAKLITIFIFWLMIVFSFISLFFNFFIPIFALIGIIVGFLYWKSKIKAFDQKKYFLFNKNTRLHGRYMLIVGLLSTIVSMYYLLKYWLVN